MAERTRALGKRGPLVVVPDATLRSRFLKRPPTTPPNWSRAPPPFLRPRYGVLPTQPRISQRSMRLPLLSRCLRHPYGRLLHVPAGGVVPLGPNDDSVSLLASAGCVPIGERLARPHLRNRMRLGTCPTAMPKYGLVVDVDVHVACRRRSVICQSESVMLSFRKQSHRLYTGSSYIPLSRRNRSPLRRFSPPFDRPRPNCKHDRKDQKKEVEWLHDQTGHQSRMGEYKRRESTLPHRAFAACFGEI